MRIGDGGVETLLRQSARDVGVPLRVQDQQGAMMWDIIQGVIFAEAVVNLIFNGTVLQPLRESVIRSTPFLSVREEHLLSCKLCTSFWVGLLTATVITTMMGYIVVRIIVLGVVLHRLSNHFHLVFSVLRDVQFDIRVNRSTRR